MPIPFLGSIVTALASAAGNFLGGAASGAGQAAGSAGVSGLLGGASGRVRREDVVHNQNMADLVNPREIARQSEFLTGIAPAQADAYNTYHDATHSADTNREIARMQAMAPVQAQTDLQYMDTVYAGTSPWERLGSSAAPSISAPNPTGGAPSRATPDVGSQFLPLIQAQIQADTARDVASIGAMSQQTIAQMNNETQLKTVGIQTDDGNLPKNQAAASAAQRLLTLAQTEGQEVTTMKSKFETNRVRQATEIDAVSAMLSAMPEEQINLGLIQYKEKPGWKNVLSLMTGDQSISRWTTPNISAALNKLPNSEWVGVKRDAIELAAALTKGTQAVGGAGKFLTGLFKGKK